MANAKNQEKVRLNLELSETVRDQLEELKTKSDATSVTEVIRRSLALYDLYVDHVLQGGAIILRDSKGEEERLKIL